MSTLDIFWTEWNDRQAGEHRSLSRARHLATALGLIDPGRPVLTVVGSKGKGTAATYASAFLTAAGMRVVTVTSPGFRSMRDRIRVNGVAVTSAEMSHMARRLATARTELPNRSDGYLSPSGLFMLAGVMHAQAVDADVIVLEAGLGGLSDEVSLFPPTVAAITPIFREHIGTLGDTPAEIAADKAGIVAATTRAVVSAAQDDDSTRAITGTIVARTDERVPVAFIQAGTSGIPLSLLPAGLGRFNAEIGCVAGHRMVSSAGRPVPMGEQLASALSSVSLPGRLSWHPVPDTAAVLLADCAINRTGICCALTEARRYWDGIDHVLVCLPDHKDVAGAVAELAGLAVTFVRLSEWTHLDFTHELPSDWEVVDVTELDDQFLAARGQRLVALGTVYFIGYVLGALDADTDRLFTVPGASRSGSTGV